MRKDIVNLIKHRGAIYNKDLYRDSVQFTGCWEDGASNELMTSSHFKTTQICYSDLAKVVQSALVAFKTAFDDYTEENKKHLELSQLFRYNNSNN